MRKDNNSTVSRVRCPVFPTLRLPYCLRCCIVRVYRARKVCRSTTASTPSWLSSSRAFCGIRRLRCRLGAICVLPGFFVKVCGIRWKIVLSFRTRRRSLTAMWSAQFFSFIRSALLWWQRRWSRTQSRLLCLTRMAAAMCAPSCRIGARWLPRWRVPSMGGYQGFTLPLRFNGRPHRDRMPYMGGSVGGHVTENERTRRIWSSHRPARDGIPRLQGRFGH